MEVNKEMTIGELVRRYPEAVKVLSKYGLRCAGCPAASFEKIEDVAKAHGVDVDKILEEIRKEIEK